ncbi:MAG: hypothetical protein AB7V27_03735 [Candidatus Binatia bacterium]
MSRLSIAIILIAGLVAGWSIPPRRLADGSNYVVMADSLWVDGDLTYSAEDLKRARALHFADVPNGLFLTKQDWGYTYGKPALYPLLTTPFYALFGVRGFFAFNGLLLAALVLLGADILRHRLDRARAFLASAVVVGFSVTPAYVHWIDPFLLFSVLVAGAVAAYRRGLPAVCGALLAALVSCRVPYGALAIAPLGLYALGRRWRALGSFALGGFAVMALLLGFGRFASGQWSPYTGERFYYGAAFPYEKEGAITEVGRPVSIHVRPEWPGAYALARSNAYFFLGRFAGVLVHYPTLLACLLWSRTWDREKVLWLFALIASCEAIQLALPDNIMGGAHTLGNRLFVMLPLAMVFVDFVRWCPYRALATAALLLIAAPLVRSPLQLSLRPGQKMVDAPYRYLPFEWTQARFVDYPARFPGMFALTHNQYSWEQGGVWTRSGTTAEFVFFASPPSAPRVRLTARESGARVSDGGTPVAAQWKSGQELEITLAHPVVTYRERRGARNEVSVYHLSITTDGGPPAEARDGGGDHRSLGVFVRPVPTPAPAELLRR